MAPMPFRGWLACALGACAIGCGDSGGGDLSALFEALNGDYQVREESDCVIAIRGSRFETRTSTGNTTCSETYTYEDGSEGETEVLRVSGTLSDTRISGTLFNEEAWSLGLDPNCETREGFRHEIRASADKRSGRTAAGRFEGLAGVWEGEVELLEYNFVQECDSAEERYDDSGVSEARWDSSIQLPSGSRMNEMRAVCPSVTGAIASTAPRCTRLACSRSTSTT